MSNLVGHTKLRICLYLINLSTAGDRNKFDFNRQDQMSDRNADEKQTHEQIVLLVKISVEEKRKCRQAQDKRNL